MNRIPSEKKPRVAYVATLSLLISLGGLLACAAAALFFLPLMGFIGIAMLAGVALFSLVFGVHYVLWGWWLPKLIERDREDSDRDA